jgi:flotillin
MLEHLDNLAEVSSKAISNIKFDKVVVWENGASDGKSSTANFLSGLARSMPPMMQVMKDIGGIELPEALIRFAGDTPPTTGPSNNGGATVPPRDTTPDRGTT